jgi:hypothetical protein
VVVVAAVLFETLTFSDKTLVDVLVPALFLAAAFFVGKQVQRQRQRAGELAEHAALQARTHRLEMHAAARRRAHPYRP